MHHFAHHTGHNCEYGYESSLHLAAKEILSKAKRITLPAVYVSFPTSYKKSELYSKAREIEIERVELEKRFDDIIPDVVIYTGGKKFYLEIYVTHPIDDSKLAKLKKADASTIEVDLCKKERTITIQELNDILLGDSKEKTWKYNAKANRLLERFYAATDKRKLITRGFALHADNCPIKKRTWQGKAYANFIDDCLYCEYCISNSAEDGFLCSGRSRISTIKDFGIPEDVRIKKSNEEFESQKSSDLASGSCPNCGGKLIQRQGKHGEFWGCSNFPHCRFTASMDPNTGEITMKA